MPSEADIHFLSLRVLDSFKQSLCQQVDAGVPDPTDPKFRHIQNIFLWARFRIDFVIFQNKVSILLIQPCDKGRDNILNSLGLLR